MVKNVLYIHQRKRILLDLDGVVFNVIDQWLENYNKKFDDNIKATDLTDFWIHNFCKKCPKDVLYGPGIITNEIMLKSPFYSGAKEKIKELSKHNDIIFVTSTFKHNRIARMKRLCKEFDDIKFDVSFTEDKTSIRGDIIVDDYINHIRNYQYIHPNSRCVLVRKPWNMEYKWDDCINELSELNPLI